jgi:hypothetical protein
MKLVEAEATGPVEGEEPIVTAPRPLHRRVSVSLLFTLTVLIGTVVTIYLVFDARHNVMLTEALVQHRQNQSPEDFELKAPSADKLGTWGLGMFGERLPMPPASIPIVGARRIEILNRRTAVIRLKIGNDEVTYIVQHAKGIVPEQNERTDGDLRAVQWLSGVFICAAAGPDASSKDWRKALHAP